MYRLYGLALHQAYEYYVHYPYDKLWLKIYVSAAAAAIPLLVVEMAI